jgi:ParB-like chromosome segregation protein Spo0J
MAKEPAKNKQPPEAEKKEVQWADLSDLRLDGHNPRLKEGMENASQPDLLAELAREYELQDLGRSIADNGYFSEEPLVAIKDTGGKAWTIIEGNRRLAALQLLDNPNAAPKELRNQWQELSTNRKKLVKSVPILEYAKRSEITPYLGFRHITGVMQWRPYQKARYIAQLVEADQLTFAQIARIIGSRAPTVREHYIAYTLSRQARDQMAIDTSYAEQAFGVLRRSLSDPNIREYIGLELDKSEQDLGKPVPRNRANNVKEFFEWIFGTRDKRPVLRESRELKKLGVIMAHTRALDVLRSSDDLDYAFEISGGEERKLLENLNSASYNLDQALPLSIRHKKSKDVMEALIRCRDTLFEILKNFPSVKDE